MVHWAPIPVVLPLLAAAVLAGAGSHFPRRLLDTLALLVTGVVLVVCAVLTVASRSDPIVYWFGAWRPDRETHFPVGISFVIDPLGAGLATLAALLVLASFFFSWGYFKTVKSLYHSMMLVFLAAMCGMCLTGDLFNLFVWFELMTAAGVALCGYESEEYGPLQGALNFAILNTVGAFLSLSGVALLYAYAGTLNMAQMAESLGRHPPGGYLLPVALLFLVTGFLVKAAAFPFHFWLADAHAVAPTPVCILFSGVMVELGVYAVARVYWAVFADAVAPNAATIRSLFLVIGTLTALIGAAQCYGQRHLKRMLAFSTISHMGLMFIGFALLIPGGLAGTAVYVAGHGLVKASLFITAGILLHRFQGVDEYDLKGKGRALPYTGALMALGALGLAGAPPFATFNGEAMIDHAAESLHAGWVRAVFFIAGALTAAAVLRVFGRVFLGWGGEPAAATAEAPRIPMESETDEKKQNVPATMWVPACLLLIAALGVGCCGAFGPAVEACVRQMQHTSAFASRVLEATPLPALTPGPGLTAADARGAAGQSAAVVIAALLMALWGLFPDALGRRLSEPGGPALKAAMHPLRLLHSGRVGDYTAWLIFGVAAYGLFLVLRWG